MAIKKTLSRLRTFEKSIKTETCTCAMTKEGKNKGENEGREGEK
jgi:hypothetical protein